jgi:hypothetical protein
MRCWLIGGDGGRWEVPAPPRRAPAPALPRMAGSDRPADLNDTKPVVHPRLGEFLPTPPRRPCGKWQFPPSKTMLNPLGAPVSTGFLFFPMKCVANVQPKTNAATRNAVTDS